MAGLTALWLATGVQAAATEKTDNPYQAIVDRNPFGLKPPVVPPPVATAPPAPPINVTMTGITADSSSTKKAWLTANVAGKTPPVQYYSLAVGDKQDNIEVLEIDEKAESVKAVIGGVPTTLTFATHGAKGGKGASAGPQPVPGVPPPPGTPLPLPYNPGTTPNNNAGPTVIGKGGVVMANPAPVPQNNFAAPAVPGGAVQPAYQPSNPGDLNATLRTIPTRNLRTQPLAPQNVGPSAEEQLIMMHVQKLNADKKGVTMPPVPPLPGSQ